MKIKITVASKTFLLGDYISLLGGPCLIVNTQPRFQCLWQLLKPGLESREQHSAPNFHPNSPAGKFIARYAQDFAGYALSFFDPHQGAGGFGASSAQFVMAYALREYLEGNSDGGGGDHHAAEAFLNTYQDLAWSGMGPRPSGADCIAQMQGGLCYYHRSAGQLTALDWPFPEMDFCLLHTGHKINTHHHLQEISIDIIPAEALQQVALAAYAALTAANSADFIRALGEYAEIQKTAGLLAMTTQDLLPRIRKYKGVLFAKGCGALGADVIFVLLEPSRSLSFVSSMQRQGLRAVSLGREASRGIEIAECGKNE